MRRRKRSLFVGGGRGEIELTALYVNITFSYICIKDIFYINIKHYDPSPFYSHQKPLSRFRISSTIICVVYIYYSQ